MKKSPKFDNSDIPEEPEQADTVPVLPLKKENGWCKTGLTFEYKAGNYLFFKDDKNCYMAVSWKKIDQDRQNHLSTYKNLVQILNSKDSSVKYHIRWFDVPGNKNVKEVREILNDKQYSEYQKASWQTKKLWKNGFSTANKFTV